MVATGNGVTDTRLFVSGQSLECGTEHGNVTLRSDQHQHRLQGEPNDDVIEIVLKIVTIMMSSKIVT